MEVSKGRKENVLKWKEYKEENKGDQKKGDKGQNNVRWRPKGSSSFIIFGKGINWESFWEAHYS